MKAIHEAREQLGRTWENRWLGWLSGAGTWPLTLALGPPSQKEALSDWVGFVAWRDSWVMSGAAVSSVNRAWPSLGGAQVLPTQVSFDGPEALAQFLGTQTLAAWRRGLARLLAWQARWPSSVPGGRGLRWLIENSEEDFTRMTALVGWMQENPGADLFIRQVPVPGIDTKWAERRSAVALALLHSAINLDASGASAFKRDRPRLRMRLLDPVLRASVGGLDDVSAPIGSISALSLPVRCAVIVENLQTFLAFDDIPGVALFFGQGFAARGLSKIAWLRKLPILYWGDIDTAGFEILNAVRSELPHAMSFGMDAATLSANRALCVLDPKQRRAELLRLTPAEQTTYHQLFNDQVFAGMRLEQERLEWGQQWPRLLEAVARLTAHHLAAQQ
ncbi:Wadjet anti-phage system protein JetD domain-containing protein [Xanthomonas campestris pv. plantaginis]|uniref:Wadjet anti-phage system protein JetD domain-containing protein n=1 Tax=Xanthomonas campestris TaxID=339 RepID=UPI002B23066A|nr:Wadjet anti-phage system protein JetD domain-containing protein [Xanthomonas campestris]MEA9606597.1 Wadjet anti-phage system protein JetD domain-containing protein [Xanthomonas campestris pv. plantaginis]